MHAVNVPDGGAFLAFRLSRQEPSRPMRVSARGIQFYELRVTKVFQKLSGEAGFLPRRPARRTTSRLEQDRSGGLAALQGSMHRAQAERQTRKDSTEGAPRAMGRRGARAADTLG
jgi:hypothetical protein